MCLPASNNSLDPAGTKEPDAVAHPRMNHIYTPWKGRLTRAIRKLEGRTSCPRENAQSIENATLKRNTIDILLVFNKMIHFQANEIFSVGPFIMLDIDGLSRETFVRFARLLNWRPEMGGRGEGVDSGVLAAVEIGDAELELPEPRIPGFQSDSQQGLAKPHGSRFTRKSECYLFS